MKNITNRTFNKTVEELNETINYLLERKAVDYDMIKDDIDNQKNGIGEISDYSSFVLEHIKHLDIAIEGLENLVLTLTKEG